jgi:hypothetical protein
VLENIVDESGHNIPIYEQKDIGEFFTVFLERLQDGLGENKAMIRKLMGEDLAKTMDINAQNHDLLGLSSQCTTVKVSSIVSDYIMMPGKPVEKVDEIPEEGKTNSNKIDSLFDHSDKMILKDNFKSGISMIDPDKASILVNYDLDAFRNSIWENFIGSQIEYVKLIEPDGT